MSELDKNNNGNSVYDSLQKLYALQSELLSASQKLNESGIVDKGIKNSFSGVFAAAIEMQKIFSASKISTAFENLSSIASTVSKAYEAFDSLNSPINVTSTRKITAALENLFSSTSALSNLDFSDLKTTVPLLSDLQQELDITEDEVEQIIDNGDITEDDIANALKSHINGEENKSSVNKSEKVKKVIKKIVSHILIISLMIFMSPIDEAIKTKIVEQLKLSVFWQKTGLLDWIESWSENDNTVSEDEAKAAVDENKTGNISKQKREDLLNKIEEIRKYISNAPQDENTGNLLSYLSEIEKDVNGKKYGLVFEEHREDIDEVLDTHTPVLTENKDLFIDNGGQMNYLIEGDNLASLKLLEKTHKGKIDVIYIDPPYNTGNKDFVYDDNYVNSDDLFNHSKWISFMYTRLNVAKCLLKDEGIIFISIGEYELPDLKLMGDEIFGETNCLSIVPRLMKSGGNKGRFFSPNIDYVLVYAKNQLVAKDFKGELDDKIIKRLYNKTETKGDRKGERFRPFGLYQSSLDERPNQRYYIECPDGTFAIPPGQTMPKNILDGEKVLPNKGDGCWRWSQERYLEEKQKGNILFTPSKNGVLLQPDGSKSKWNVYTKIWLSDRQEEGQTPTNFINKFENRHSAKELKEIGVSFDFAKPTGLISYLIKLTGTTQNATCLDFFAGSGTTGHAVMKLNADDGGNRSFILCTNNENNICRDVTYERIKRVIDKENYSASLKYYKVDYVPISERMYYEYADELLKHIRELVELENGINFIGNAEIAIVLTDEELNDFTNNVDQYSACKKLYMGHDLLPNEEQERIIRENDIEISIIPDYYYKDLQEK